MTLRPLGVAILLIAPMEVAHGTESMAEPLPRAASYQHLPLSASASKLIGQIESLFRLQDDGARGSLDSIPAQKELLIDIGRALAVEPLDSARHLVLHAAAYTLSGGNPDAVERLSTSEALDSEQKLLLRAVTAFMQGEREEAKVLFAEIQLSSFPGFLSGRLALARAVLEADASARLQDDLGFAIAAMPGTLVEESALRRSALAYGNSKDEQRFFQRIERYGRRFPESVYAQSFWNEAADIITKWNSGNPGAVMLRLEASVGHLSAPRRRQIYLDIVRKAAASGQRELTEKAAGQLMKLAVSGTPDYEVGKLYGNLYAVVTAENAPALRSLEAIDPGKLDKQDQSFLHAAISIGRRLSAPVLAGGSAPETDGPGPDPVVEKADGLLKQTEELLQKMRS